MGPGKPWNEKALSAWSVLPYPFLLVLCLGFVTFTRLTPTRNGAWVTEALVKIGEAIPEEDKEEGNVLAVDMPCGNYFDIGVLPEFPYAGYHSVHASQFVPEMLDLLTGYIAEEADWVLVNDAPYEHPELPTLYSTEEFSLALEEGGFLLREDLSVDDLVLVYERT